MNGEHLTAPILFIITEGESTVKYHAWLKINKHIDKAKLNLRCTLYSLCNLEDSVFWGLFHILIN